MFDIDAFSDILKKIANTYESISEFADKSKVNRTYLSKYINKKLDTPPSPKVLMKIANNSHNIISYEELMNICGFIINENLDAIRESQDKLTYDNLMKSLSLSKKESSILNSLIDEFKNNQKKGLSIEQNEAKVLKLLTTLDTSKCDIDKIKKRI